jgi:hypothetical protein
MDWTFLVPVAYLVFPALLFMWALRFVYQVSKRLTRLEHEVERLRRGDA